MNNKRKMKKKKKKRTVVTRGWRWPICQSKGTTGGTSSLRYTSQHGDEANNDVFYVSKLLREYIPNVLTTKRVKYLKQWIC
jgi:hypothetical protein